MAYKYKFIKDDCWYKDSCKHYGGEICNPSCIRYMEMDFLMQTSGIPKSKQYQNPLIPDTIDIRAYQRLDNIRQNIEDFIHDGADLYIFSDKFGNGKTTWAIKIMQRYFNQVWVGNGFRWRGIFLHVPTFITQIKENISRQDEDFLDMRTHLDDVDLVIWDDIGSFKLTDFDYTNLLTYIDKRSLNNYSNIYTGNLHGKSLRDAIGNRLYSRVWQGAVKVELKGEDRRGIKW